MRYLGRLPATVCHISLNTAVEPVKCRPAKDGWSSTSLPTRAPREGTKLITPAGSPASLYSCIR